MEILIVHANIDNGAAPNLRSLLVGLSSSSSLRSGRRMLSTESRDPPVSFLAEAVGDLAQPLVADAIRPDQFVAITDLVWRSAEGGDPVAHGLLDPLRLLLAKRWNELGKEVLRHAVMYQRYDRTLFKALPVLTGTPEILSVLTEADDIDLHGVEEHLRFSGLAPSRDQLRQALTALSGDRGDRLRSLIVNGTAEKGELAPWTKLFAILCIHPELGSLEAPYRHKTHDPRDTTGAADERIWQVWSQLYADAETRRVAGLVIDLDHALAQSPTDFREVYLDRLRAAVGDNDELRRAAIEALLWKGQHGSRHIAAFAAFHLAQPEDRTALGELAAGPDARLGYAVGALLRLLEQAATGMATVYQPAPFEARAWPAPVGGSPKDEPARTWLGNRTFERMLEAAVAGAEREFSETYAMHHGSGEERLGERFFTMLGERLRHLDGALRQTAQALGDVPAASVQVDYRPVDKKEEGDPGIVLRDTGIPADKFCADFCLIVAAFLDGMPLTRRGVLVQAKRIYLKDNADPAKGWAYSYTLKPEQARNLIEQTASSFFMFQGPAELQSGCGVVPAKLVEDIGLHQNPSAAAISAQSVLHASESFAEWFTYQVVALRTGDAYQSLLDKAQRGPGSDPYPLVRYGTIEIEVRLGEPAKEG
jgi:hypothetical protein